MKPRRLVVAGTGTDVGKTFYARRIAACLSRRGYAVRALKPMETDFRELAHSDAAAIAHAAGHEPVLPHFTHEQPLGPLAASRVSGSVLSVADVVAWVETQEDPPAHAEHSDVNVTLIETAGGLFTPLTAHDTNFDLIHALRADAYVLVARNRLGVLHDVLAVMAAAERRLPAAVILNTVAGAAPPTNLDDLRECGLNAVACDPDDGVLSELVATMLNLA